MEAGPEAVGPSLQGVKDARAVRWKYTRDESV
jgi:hypothetical protein